MNMSDIPRQAFRQLGFWAHLMSPAPDGKGFLWKCYEEAPGGTWTDKVLDEGDAAFPLNPFMPPRFPWIVPLRLHGPALLIGIRRDDNILAQLVVKENGNSYAWRKQNPMQGGRFEDAEDFPHSLAFEPNGLEPPKLPWNVFLTPRFVPNEYMFYLGGY
jgi:hypothetical protein